MSKQKILILTSNGGTGQQSVCQAMHQHLSVLYDLSEVNVTTEVMASFDPLSYLNKALNTEVVYNWLIKKNYFFILNMFVAFGGFLMKYFLHRKIQRAFQNIFSRKQPDMIISLVPYYNAYAIAAFEEKKPFVIVCCDIDIYSYVFDWPKKQYENLVFCMSISTEENNNYLKALSIDKKQVHAIGYPLRKNFYYQYSPCSPKNTITLLLGGQGSEKCLLYLKQLITCSFNLTINICIGHNKKLPNKIKGLSIPSNVTINIIPFTEDIVNVLVNSDLLITKTGSCSIFEALHLHKPILMDCTSTQLTWEKPNINYIENLGVGLPIVNLSDCVPLVEKILYSTTEREKIIKNYHKLNPTNFFQHFIAVLEQL
jgi:UDP-N-acetylglucosamine:LPS N-acetylglucosamine transferase